MTKEIFCCVVWILVSHSCVCQEKRGNINVILFNSSKLDVQSSKKSWDSIFNKARIVFLGEANHGDGETLAIKNELIKTLVSNHGFSVILLERSFYELYRANSLIGNSRISGKSSSIIMNEALRNYEFLSRGLEALGQYVIKNKKTIDIGGVEVACYTRLMDFIYSDLMKESIGKQLVRGYELRLKELIPLGLCFDCPKTNFEFAKFEAMSIKIINQLNINKKIKTKNDEVLIQAIRNNMNLAQWVKERPAIGLENDMVSVREFHRLREEFMCQNLMWQLRVLYPGRKVIVSTSTLHMTLGAREIPTMVDYLPDSIKKQSYFLPFIRYQGERGFDTSAKLTELPKVIVDSTSLEQELHSKKINYGLIDFSSLSEQGKNFIDSKSMSPSGVLPSSCKWTTIYSGLFFIDTMKPDFWRDLNLSDFENVRETLLKR